MSEPELYETESEPCSDGGNRISDRDSCVVSPTHPQVRVGLWAPASIYTRILPIVTSSTKRAHKRKERATLIVYVNESVKIQWLHSVR